jgi:hypothetical protein
VCVVFWWCVLACVSVCCIVLSVVICDALHYMLCCHIVSYIFYDILNYQDTSHSVTYNLITHNYSKHCSTVSTNYFRNVVLTPSKVQ